jgi:hypothetical protein
MSLASWSDAAARRSNSAAVSLLLTPCSIDRTPQAIRIVTADSHQYIVLLIRLGGEVGVAAFQRTGSECPDDSYYRLRYLLALRR